MALPIAPGARHILQALAAQGHEAYLVGGCVRDLLRGVTPHDWDICTSARPEETRRCFAGQRIIETGLKHGTVTVLAGTEPYEITTYRMEGPYSDRRRPDYVRFVPNLAEDLARRDFTMNAVAMDLAGNLRDPFGGAQDIKRGLIRCVGEPDLRFQEDGLRVMRALRFASALGYGMEERTAGAVRRNRAVLSRVAAERINAELCKLLEGRGAGAVLRQYPDVFCQFWPELGPLVTLEQNNPWHCWGGWAHTIHAVEALKRNDIATFGKLINDSHVSLRDDYEGTGIELDTLVEEAWKVDGCIGSRMTGAGFGGCTVSIVKDEAIDTFIEKVGKAYQEKIGYAADFYVVEVGDGPVEL